VTADGHVRIANAARIPISSGRSRAGGGGAGGRGGGSWGVVTRLTLRTYELPKFFGAAWGKITANSADATENC